MIKKYALVLVSFACISIARAQPELNKLPSALVEDLTGKTLDIRDVALGSTATLLYFFEDGMGMNLQRLNRINEQLDKLQHDYKFQLIGIYTGSSISELKERKEENGWNFKIYLDSKHNLRPHFFKQGEFYAALFDMNGYGVEEISGWNFTVVEVECMLQQLNNRYQHFYNAELFPCLEKDAIITRTFTKIPGRDGWNVRDASRDGVIPYMEGVFTSLVPTLKAGKINYYYFYPSGPIYYESYYNVGGSDHPEKDIYYHKNGRKWTERIYDRDGGLYEISYCYDKNGNPLDFGDFRQGNGVVKNYNSDGKVTELKTYVNGKKIKTVKL